MTEIIVSADLVKRCIAKAKAAMKSNTTKGRRERYSKGAISKERKIEINVAGFVGEVALCIYLGLNPDTALDWQTSNPDAGHDIRVNSKTIDVKASPNAFASRLMWPVTKMEKLPQAADIFVLAVVPFRATPHLDGQPVRLAGWVTRDEFIAQCWKAKAINGVVDGTPYMNEKSLYSMEQIVQHLGHVQATEAGATS